MLVLVANVNGEVARIAIGHLVPSDVGQAGDSLIARLAKLHLQTFARVHQFAAIIEIQRRRGAWARRACLSAD